MQIILYILSISLQLGGSILGISSISTKRESILRDFFKSKFTSLDGNTNEIYYNNEAYLDKWKSTYNNKFSFVYLAAGYSLSPLSEFDGSIDKYLTLLLIVLLSIILIIFEKIIIKVLIKAKKVNKKITYKEIREYNLDVDMATASKKAIDEIFNEVFDEFR